MRDPFRETGCTPTKKEYTRQRAEILKRLMVAKTLEERKEAQKAWARMAWRFGEVTLQPYGWSDQEWRAFIDELNNE